MKFTIKLNSKGQGPMNLLCEESVQCLSDAPIRCGEENQ